MINVEEENTNPEAKNNNRNQQIKKCHTYVTRFEFLFYICHMDVTKSKILSAAIEVLGKDLGASLDEIAKHAGISRRTLHRHFNGREDIMNAVFNHIIAVYHKDVKSILRDDMSTEERMKAFLAYDIESGTKHTVFCQLRKNSYTEYAAENENLQELFDIINNLFESLIKEGKIRDEIPQLWLAAFYNGVLESALQSFKQGVLLETCQIIAWSSFWNGIKK